MSQVTMTVASIAVFICKPDFCWASPRRRWVSADMSQCDPEVTFVMKVYPCNKTQQANPTIRWLKSTCHPSALTGIPWPSLYQQMPKMSGRLEGSLYDWLIEEKLFGMLLCCYLNLSWNGKHLQNGRRKQQEGEFHMLRGLNNCHLSILHRKSSDSRLEVMQTYGRQGDLDICGGVRKKKYWKMRNMELET